ncbi:MAG: hypothetical protein AAGJ87_00355 [Pseudomonadota bacterium]
MIEHSDAFTAEFGNKAIDYFRDDPTVDVRWSSDQSDTLRLFPDATRKNLFVDVYLGNAIAEIRQGDISVELAMELYIFDAIKRVQLSNEIVPPSEFRLLVRHRRYMGDKRAASLIHSQRMNDLPDRSGNLTAYEVLTDDLVAIIGAETPGGWSYSIADSISSAGMSYSDAKELALENTLPYIQAVDVQGGEKTLGMVTALDPTNEGHLSIFTLTKLLDVDFWEQLEARYGYRIAVTTPDRYTFLFAPADNPDAIALLIEKSKSWADRSDHPQSIEPLLWTGEGWSVLRTR